MSILTPEQIEEIRKNSKDRKKPSGLTQQWDLFNRALGVPIGTLGSMLPGVAKAPWDAAPEGISAALEEIPDEGATFEDYHRAITAYHEEFDAVPGFWGTSELLGGAIIPTGAPAFVGSKLISAAPKLGKMFHKGASMAAPKRLKPEKWEIDAFGKGMFDKKDIPVHGPYGGLGRQHMPRSPIGKVSKGLEETVTEVGKAMKVPWQIEGQIGQAVLRPLSGIIKGTDTPILKLSDTLETKIDPSPQTAYKSTGDPQLRHYESPYDTPIPALESPKDMRYYRRGGDPRQETVAIDEDTGKIVQTYSRPYGPKSEGGREEIFKIDPEEIAGVKTPFGKDWMPQGAIKSLSSFARVVDSLIADDSWGGFVDKLTKIRGLTRVIKLASPSAIAKTPHARAIIARDVLNDQAQTMTDAALTQVSRVGSQESLFGKVDKTTGALTGNVGDRFIPFKSKPQIGLHGRFMNTIRATYKTDKELQEILTDKQKEWLDALAKIEADKRIMLKQAGINIKEIPFDEGGTIYAGRRMVYRKGADGTQEIGYIGKVKGVTAQEKKRVFKTQEQAAEMGFKDWLPEDQAVHLNLKAAYETIVDRKFAEWLVGRDISGKLRVPNLRLLANKPPRSPAVRLPRNLGYAVYKGPHALEMKKAMEDSVQNVWAKQRPGILGPLLFAGGKYNALRRFMQLNGDASPFMIQLIFLAGVSPKQWAGAIGAFAQSLFDPRYHAKMISNNQDLIARHPNMLLTSSGSEMTEALDRGGILTHKLMTIPRIGLTPFARAFNTALDSAGISMAKSLDDTLKIADLSPSQIQQVDSFINEFRGLSSSARLGVRPKQRDIENMLLLAPRYNRAMASLVFDMISDGGIRGKLARKAMANSVTSLTMMGVAFSTIEYLTYTPEESQSIESWTKYVIKKIDPTSPEFYTWRVGNTNIGPGTKFRSWIYFAAKIFNDPTTIDDGKIDASINFIRGQSSPLISDAWSMFTGYNYIGDPTGINDGLPDDLLTDMGQFVGTIGAPALMPIWVQTLALEGGSTGQKLKMSMADFFGLRAYPVSGTQLREQEAKNRGYENYDSMDRNIKQLVDKEIEKQNPEVYRGKTWIIWGKKRDEVYERFHDAVNKKVLPLLIAPEYSSKYAPILAMDILNELQSELHEEINGKFNPETQQYEGGINEHLYGKDYRDQDKDKSKYGTREHLVERYYNLFRDSRDEDGNIDWVMYRENATKFWASLSAISIDQLFNNIKILEGELHPLVQEMSQAGAYALSTKVEVRGQMSNYYGLKTHPDVVSYVLREARRVNPSVREEQVLYFLNMQRKEQKVAKKEEPWKSMFNALSVANSTNGILRNIRSEFIKKAPDEWFVGMLKSGYEYSGDENYNELIYERVRDGWVLPELDYIELLKVELRK